MTDFNTPLSDIALLLDIDTATLLLEKSDEEKETCLRIAKIALIELEARDLFLDPIELGRFLHDSVIRSLKSLEEL